MAYNTKRHKEERLRKSLYHESHESHESTRINNKEFSHRFTPMCSDYLLQYFNVDIGLSREVGLPISTIKFCNKFVSSLISNRLIIIIKKQAEPVEIKEEF
jgi:hypothetical protein